MGKQESHAVISAIIEREYAGKKQILIMTRDKPKRDPKYSGTLEIPAGHIDAFENVYETVKREVKEETNLTITDIYPYNKTKTHSPRDDGAFAFEPFCCQQQVKGGKPWVGCVFLCKAEGELKTNPDECKDARWMDVDELKNIIAKTPEKIFTLQLGALDYYINRKWNS